MQGKDAHNPDAGYPHLPAQDTTGAPPAAPPPYTDYAQPYPGHPQGNPGYPPQGNPGYTPQGNSGYPHPTGPQVQGPTVLPTATIIVQTVVGPEPTRATCRNCNKEMTTRVDTRPTMKTHLMALLLCVLGCWPCVCVPYCMDSCLDTDHYCSKCNAFLGSYSR